MPAKIKVTRERIIEAAFELVRTGCADALSARGVAAAIGCSTQPIFSNFPNMEGLRSAVLERAWMFYTARTSASMQEGLYPPYKASGMSYITFAVEEPRLFKLLFMRDRIADGDADRDTEQEDVIAAIMRGTGLSLDTARRFHREMWIFVHGIAVMVATQFTVYDEAAVSAMLSEVYDALLKQFAKEGRIRDE